MEPPDFSGIFKVMKQKEPKSFLIIDDHTLMVSAIVQLLKCDFQHAAYHTAANGKEALEILKVTPVDMIFLDVSMPEMNGYETFPILKSTYPSTPVILLTMLHDESVVHHFIQLGITAIMLKSCEEGLATAVRTVWESGGYFSDEIAEIIKKNLLHVPGKIPNGASHLNLLRYISKGKTSKEMAGLLSLSENTVNSYRQDLLKSTHTKNTDELIAFGYRTGLLH